MTLQLEPDEGEESDAEQQIRRQLEKRFERELTGAFDEQLNALLPDNASDDTIRSAPGQVTQSSEPVREVLRRNLESGSELGVSVAFDTLEQIGLAFDYTLAHAEAARWASQYSYSLIRGINATTQARMQTAVEDWFQERTTLPDLVRELEPTFGRKRAKLIAQTETTRAAAEGNIVAYEESRVVQEWEWQTVRDEKVCPTCGPLHGTRAPLRGTFPGGITIPAHPGCRCFGRPVIQEPPRTEVPAVSEPPRPLPPPAWEPSMDRATAERWAANSQYREDTYHVTPSAANARSIAANGFDLSQNKFGRMWGDGVYVGADSATAEIYTGWAGEDAQRLTIKLNIQKPFIYREVWSNFKQSDIVMEMLGTEDRVQAVDLIRNNPQGLSGVLSDAGYDALHIIPRETVSRVGGNQLVIFDPKKVVVIRGD